MADVKVGNGFQISDFRFQICKSRCVKPFSSGIWNLESGIWNLFSHSALFLQ